ncbi:MAG: nickel pincer cofactor biosynthesis protein LarC [Cyclobacteriaceae bacterium]|nr:nickel pincer cofactor biosynthesis protein LarC [Cyclobacteriaceae bacterium]
MSILKIEAFSGLSGDMFLGALTSLCDMYEEIQGLPERLGLAEEAEVIIHEVNKKGIVCHHIRISDKTRDKGHSHPHRHLSHIQRIIENAAISEGAKQIAGKIFLLLGEAESQVHGIPIEKIHFHEVGAIDSIMDIVGTSILLDKLEITKTYCTTVNTGSGFVNTAHGRLPVPTPATKILLMGCPTASGEIESELTTPTGAAILKYLDPDFNIPALIDEKIGHGPGEKEFEIPNILRISLCKAGTSNDRITVLQTNIDDMSGEYLGTEFQDKLFRMGALDLYFEQVIMKRGRPGVVLNVLTRKENADRIADCIFGHTTSIGIRYFEAGRYELEREIKEVDTLYGKIRLKETLLPGNTQKRSKPESRDIFRIAEQENKSSLYILNQIQNSIKNENH